MIVIRIDDVHGATRVLAHSNEPIDGYGWRFFKKLKGMQSWQYFSNHVPGDQFKCMDDVIMQLPTEL